MYKVNNKDTTPTSLNKFEQISHSGASIIDFEQKNASY